MIRRLAPRRLGTDEEATVVEHLIGAATPAA